MNTAAKRRRFNSRSVTMFLFTIPAVILYGVFFIYPILAGTYYSFTNWDGIRGNYEWIGLQNYIDILGNTRFQKAALFNLRYTLMLTTGIVLISLVLALILNMALRAKTFFRAAYFFPAVISMLTAGLIFNEIFYRVVPRIGDLLHIGWLQGSLLANRNTAIFAILFVNLWQGVAMPTILLMAGLQSVPTELYESASMDGANRWRQFKDITFPFLLPVLTVVIVLAVKDGLTVYDYIVSLTNGGPGGATESISLMIYNHGFKEVKFAYGIAEAILLTIVICVISLVQVSYNNKKKVY